MLHFFLLPVLRAVLELLSEQSRLELHQLLKEVGSNLEVVSLTVEVLEGLVERPLVLLYQVGGYYGEGTALPPQRADQNTLVPGISLVHEVADGVEVGIAGVQNYFIVGVQPLEVDGADPFVLVVDKYFACCAVDDGAYLIGQEEVELVGRLSVTDEQPVLDLEGEVQGLHANGPDQHIPTNAVL